MVADKKLELSKYLLKTSYILISVFILCWPIFAFGKPYYYHDTMDYLYNVQNLEYVSLFRSTIGYSLFIRFICFPGFLVSVPLIQSLILVLILRQVLIKLYKNLNENHLLLAFLLLSLFTIVDILTTTIMPDIFAPILLFSYYLLSIEECKIKKFIYGFIFCLSITMHNLYPFIAASLILISILKKKLNRIIIFYFIVGISFVPIWFLVLKGNVYPHRSGAKFIAVLVESGLLKKYLSEHCSTEPHYLCEYQNILPNTAYGFAWNKNWTKKTQLIRKGNLEPLIWGIISSYPIESFNSFFISAIKQSFIYINIITNSIANAMNHTNRKYVKYESLYFSFRGLNKLILLSMLIFVIKKNKNPDANTHWLLILFIAAYFTNSIMNGIISYPTLRYSLRFIWLIPFFFFFEFVRMIEDKYSKQILNY